MDPERELKGLKERFDRWKTKYKERLRAIHQVMRTVMDDHKRLMPE